MAASKTSMLFWKKEGKLSMGDGPTECKLSDIFVWSFATRWQLIYPRVKHVHVQGLPVTAKDYTQLGCQVNCHLDNCPPDNCPPDNCPPDNSHLGQLPSRVIATQSTAPLVNCPLGQLPPRKIAPRTIAPWTIADT